MTEDELRIAMSKLEASKGQMNELLTQQELLHMSLEEHLRARETIKRYHESQVGDEILIPVGANCFLFANISDNKKAVIGLGSDIVVEDKVRYALERLEKKINQMEDAEKKLGERIINLDNEVRKHSVDVQSKYEELQKQQQV